MWSRNWAWQNGVLVALEVKYGRCDVYNGLFKFNEGVDARTTQDII
jgi:hypothetical protein